MPIVRARRYANGTLCDPTLAIDGERRAELPEGTFDWVGVADPSAEEMAALQRQFGLHPLAVEDSLNAAQQPKVEIYGQQLFVVARTAGMGPGESIGYGQTACFIGRDFLITVRHGSARAHIELRRQLELRPERLAEGPDFVLHAVLDFIVDGYLPIVEGLEGAVQGIEEQAIDEFPAPPTIRRIFRLRRQILRFERIVGPTEELCLRLATTELPTIDASARIWFRDVLDHIRRVLTRMRSLKDTLDSVVETASLLEQHRQGEMTRQLASWAAILAVPTAIAGIYGMNFEFMPELTWRYGYFMVLGVIAAVCLGLYLRFKRIGWL